MNQLSTQKRAEIVHHLVEGNSLRSTARLTKTDVNTVMSLLKKVGRACEIYQDQVFRELKCERIEVDEIWSYIRMKEDNVPEEVKGGPWGDSYTWIAIDADSKLVPCWHVGRREVQDCYLFINDLASRMARRIQLSSDGFKAYPPAVAESFGHEVDFGTPIKNFDDVLKLHGERIAPKILKSTRGAPVIGNPDLEKIGTSIIERQNFTVRMSLGRFRRLSNTFSKTFENHKLAVALHYMHYNFVRRHGTLKMPPALYAGITDHWWEIEEIVGLVDLPEVKAQAA